MALPAPISTDAFAVAFRQRYLVYAHQGRVTAWDIVAGSPAWSVPAEVCDGPGVVHPAHDAVTVGGLGFRLADGQSVPPAGCTWASDVERRYWCYSGARVVEDRDGYRVFDVAGQVVFGPYPELRDVAWSSDETELAISDRAGLRIVDTLDWSTRWLHAAPDQRNGDDALCWAGRRLLWFTAGFLYSFDAPKAELTRKREVEDFDPYHTYVDLTASQDGSDALLLGEREIAMIFTPESLQTRYRRELALFGQWAPTRSEIAVVSQYRATDPALRLSPNPNGSQVRVVDPNGENSCVDSFATAPLVAWSPDGSAIALFESFADKVISSGALGIPAPDAPKAVAQVRVGDHRVPIDCPQNPVAFGWCDARTLLVVFTDHARILTMS